MRSGIATVTGRGLALAIQLGISVVLARLLTPEDFGVQAMVIPIAILLIGVTNAGVQSAVIQRDVLDHRQASALFWTSIERNTMLCFSMAVGMVALSYLYHEPRVVGVGIAWSVIILWSSASAVPEGMLKRQFRFPDAVRATLIGLVCSAIAGVAAAALGARHWSLIAQLGAFELVRCSIVWRVSGWRPDARETSSVERREAASELHRYWKGFAGARTFNWAGDYADRITMATFAGAQALGLYEASKRWGAFAFLELQASLAEVAIAGLSRVRLDPPVFARQVRNVFLPVLAVSLPVVGFMFVEARGVLRVLLGHQWLDAATMLRVICVSTAFLSITRLCQWIYLSTGATDRQMRWAMVTMPVFFAAALIGRTFGIPGIGIGLACANIALAVPSVMFAIRGTSLTLSMILSVWLAPLLATVVAAAGLAALGSRLPNPERLIGLGARGCVFAVIYGVAWLAMPGGRAMLAGLRLPHGHRD